VTRKYPLDPLKRVRAEKVDERARAMSLAIGQVEKARAEKEQREHAKRALERSLAETARAEGEKLERGELSVADLARGAAFGIAGEMRRAVHAQAVDQARSSHTQAVTHAELTRQSLATARADAEVVEKHHQKWQKAELAKITAKEEESAEEAHLSRSRERGPR
jgi:aspartyl aminopeptidase